MMKMRNLLLGFILGLLTAVHSTPVNTETSIPPKPEDDVFEEAMTDGFLVEHSFVPSVTTESIQKNTTIQASVRPPSDSMTEGSAEIPSSTLSELGVGHSYATSVSRAQGPTFTQDYTADGSFPSLTTASTELSATTQASLQTSSDLTIEGSAEIPLFTLSKGAGGDPTTTTGLSVSHTENPAFTVNPDDSTIQTFQSGFTSLAAPKEARSKIFSISQNSASASDFLNSFDWLSGSGSGDFETSPPVNVETTESTTVTTSLSSTDAPEKMTKEDSQAIVGVQLENQAEFHKGHNTPDWIIIVGFLVGLAALIMLCAAIATKDKWNAPKQPSENSAKTNSSNQKMELEMQTFLQKDEPKEEGKDSEYMVIPLDELPENYSSD